MPDRALEELLDQAIDAILAGAAPETSGPELDSLVRIAGARRRVPRRRLPRCPRALRGRAAAETACASARSSPRSRPQHAQRAR